MVGEFSSRTAFPKRHGLLEDGQTVAPNAAI